MDSALKCPRCAGRLFEFGPTEDRDFCELCHGAGTLAPRQVAGALAHAMWAGWMKYLFTKGRANPDGSFELAASSVARWRRQLATAFGALPREEQASDLVEGDKMLALKRGQAAFRATVDALMEEASGVYTERNRCAVALARAALALGWGAGIGRDPAPECEEDFRTVLFVDLPAGQVSWHIHDSERALLDGLPAYAAPWDGHSDLEKTTRLARFWGTLSSRKTGA